MAIAEKGDTVKVHYTGRLRNGDVFDSSEDREPLEFVLGEGMVIDGFDAGVVGMAKGDKKTVDIPVDLAYGPRLEEYVVRVERSNLPGDFFPQIGDHYEIPMPTGEYVPVTVTEVSDTAVTLDANPPLAGEDLIFDLELIHILKA